MKKIVAITFLFTNILFSQWENQYYSSALYSITLVGKSEAWIAGEDFSIIKLSDNDYLEIKYSGDVSKDFQSIAFFNEKAGFAIGTKGSIYLTENSGEYWKLHS